MVTIYQVQVLLLLKHTVPDKNSWKKNDEKFKREARLHLNPRLCFLMKCILLLKHPFPRMKYLSLISIYTYAYIRGKC